MTSPGGKLKVLACQPNKIVSKAEELTHLSTNIVTAHKIVGYNSGCTCLGYLGQNDTNINNAVHVDLHFCLRRGCPVNNIIKNI
jgi:hypothetical protein